MRTTVTLDDDIYEVADTLAKSSGQRLGQVLSELVRRGLGRAQDGKVVVSRFAVFDVPAGASIIPAGRVQRFLDDDGAL